MDDDLLLCRLCGLPLDEEDPRRVIEVPARGPGSSPWVALVCLGCFLARRSGAEVGNDP